MLLTELEDGPQPLRSPSAAQLASQKNGIPQEFWTTSHPRSKRSSHACHNFDMYILICIALHCICRLSEQFCLAMSAEVPPTVVGPWHRFSEIPKLELDKEPALKCGKFERITWCEMP